MSMFKDLVSKLVVSEGEDKPEISQEELEGVVKEVQEKDSQIESLKNQYEELSKEHEQLKNRVLDNLFNNAKGKPEEIKDSIKEPQEQKETKTFKELINPDYQIKND